MREAEFPDECKAHHARLCAELRRLQLRDHKCRHCGRLGADHVKDGTGRCSIDALSRKYESTADPEIDLLGKLLSSWDTVIDLQMRRDPSWL